MGKSYRPIEYFKEWLCFPTGEDSIDDGDVFPNRVRVHSVPFALQAGDADSLGGLAADDDLRIVSINQKNTAPYNEFDVYINRGTGALVDNDFVFMLTGR